MLYSDNEKIVSDMTPWEADAHQDADGVRSFGAIPRPWGTYPQGCYAGEVGVHAINDLPEINPADFPGMIAELEQSKSRLSDFRMRGNNGQMIPSRDQNGRGYCWRHSGTSAHLAIRARDEQPYLDLSAYAGACRIKQYRDEGGWGAQGVDDIFTFGDPTSDFWPQRAVSRQYDTPATWENAKKQRFTEGFIDLGSPQYDRSMTFNQMITCLLCRIPVVVDFNWWSHSVCAIDAVNGTSLYGKLRDARSGKLVTLTELEIMFAINDPVLAGIAIRIWNSWSDTWSENGIDRKSTRLNSSHRT